MSMMDQTERTIIEAAQKLCRELASRYYVHTPNTSEPETLLQHGRIAGTWSVAAGVLSDALVTDDVYGKAAQEVSA